MRRWRVVVVGAAAAAVGLSTLVGALSTPAGSATSCAASNTTVTSNADTGAGTLRTAITNANGNTGAQTICIDTTLVTAPIVLAGNLPVYTGTGTGSAPLTIQGNGAALNGNGHVAIESSGTGLLTVNRFTITGSNSGGVNGGGVFGRGGVTVTNSTVSGNTSSVGGGGIFGVGAVTVTNSTVSGNTGNGSGGGIESTGGVTVTNSTVSGNTGGGITDVFSGAVTLVYATVVQNSLGAGAQLFTATTLTSFASVVAQPRGAAPTNCVVAGATSSSGFNFSDDASSAVSCKFNSPTDHVGTSNDPMLGALANNGGPTNTMLPNAGSPLIDGVPAASCQADGAAGITTDQRGFVRPDPASPNCDIGAVEVQPAAPAAPTAVETTPRFTG